MVIFFSGYFVAENCESFDDDLDLKLKLNLICCWKMRNVVDKRGGKVRGEVGRCREVRFDWT
jgi:hypothetical protein